MTSRIFGSGIRRREDPRLITGQASYTDDIKLPHMAHDLDLTVKVWTVNEEKRMKALIEMDVDGIITDYPDRLRRVLEMRGMNLPTPTPVQP